ncbi:hypothetical protein DVH26_19115 [Paenibacillus sp. H1-7]|uniref:hypothetical protein n=1 Tax=Paenibacillus sp. H1-7 TaxID=2282849 RepID=UPI001EF8F064|nr:hypothetical protein [Paenibacillus sp. H1-7]ULL16371.1 hypothetical protein DVH26_19115 [Paenibacillus sp. H1-7]
MEQATNPDIDLLVELLVEGFLVPLRMGDGIKNDLVTQIFTLLDRISLKYLDQDSIPKSLAELFIDVYPAMLSSTGLYDSIVENEIIDIADRLLDKFRNVMYP